MREVGKPQVYCHVRTVSLVTAEKQQSTGGEESSPASDEGDGAI
jgi:hypothetical protein